VRWKGDITELLGDGDALLHAPARDGHLAPKARRGLDHQLHTRQERSKGSHNHTARSLHKGALEGVDQTPLRGGVPCRLGIGAIRQQHHDALVGEPGEGSQVGGAPLNGGVVDLEISGVHNQAERRANGIAHRVGDGMIDVEGGDVVRAQFNPLPWQDGMKVGMAQQAVALQFDFNEAARQRRGVHGHAVQLAQQEGQAPDVVLMAMGDDDAAHLGAVVDQVAKVGDDQIDAEEVLLREHEPGIDDEDVVVVLDDGTVAADLSQAAQGKYAHIAR